KRPVVAIYNSDIYIMAIDNPQTNSAYWTRTIASIPSLGGGWGNPSPLFDTEFEFYRNNIVPRDPTTSATGLPVLIDFAYNTSETSRPLDHTIWQTVLPNDGNQAPGVFAGANKTVAASPATNLGGQITNDTVGGHSVNWAWSVLSGGAVNFTNQSGTCSTTACSLPTTAAFVGTGARTLRLTATEAGTGLTNYDDVTINVNTAVNTPPVLTISKPKNGDTYAPGADVTFSATANDAQAGNISADIVWTSNKDGIIGYGGSFVLTDLTSGTHIIKANVTDGQNAVSSPNITITIGSGGGGGGGGSGTFTDDDGNIFENAIEWLAGKGITQGCNPPANTHYCPNDPVTRGQMAVFLVRAFGYSDNGGGNLFIDDNGLFYENSADRLFTAGVTVGCNPPTNNKYCGEKNVTRGQMAAFLARAFNLPAYSGPDRFTDDNGNIFEGAIERLAQAGITLGCNPPANTKYCPNDNVTRGQMAAFLKRAFGE
ncbi:MAG: S-layer homology domain-containing protein, partial [Acidimicrobiia bacterium]